MDPLRQYEIAFVGLKTGIHHFDFKIDERFLEMFTDSLVKKVDIAVNLTFDKRPSFFLLNFTLSGTVQLPCDRCAVELNFPVDADYPIVVKFDKHSEDDRDDSFADVVYIKRGDSHLNVSQLIYEFISLSFPLNHITCDNLKGAKRCNQDILDRLNRREEKKQEPRDSRWDSLSKIKFN